MPRIALSIAGSDPSGGAGIQADLKTFAAHGVYGAAVITALTAQNTCGVMGVQPVSGEFVEAQASAVLDDLEVGAIKLGMLGTREVLRAAGRLLSAHPSIPVVFDPVMVAAGGEPLLQPDAIRTLARIARQAIIVTPNVHEAGLLLDERAPADASELADQARRLAEQLGTAVLLKGGRLVAGELVVDALALPGASVKVLEHERVPVERVHGGGCTLSSAIAARVAQGAQLTEAVRDARRYVVDALLRGQLDPPGKGATALIH